MGKSSEVWDVDTAKTLSRPREACRVLLALFVPEGEMVEGRRIPQLNLSCRSVEKLQNSDFDVHKSFIISYLCCIVRKLLK